MKDTLFFVTAAAMVFMSLGVVSAKNILHAALYLIWTLSGTAMMFLLMHAEFPAVAQIMVYIGGIVVVVVFTILLTSRLGESYVSENPVRNLASGAVAIAFFLTFGYLIWSNREALDARPAATTPIASLDQMGEAFLAADKNGWLIPFELVSILLLCAIIGALILSRRDAEIDEEEGA